MTGDPLGWLENVPGGVYRDPTAHPDLINLSRQIAKEGLHVTDTSTDDDTPEEDPPPAAAEADDDVELDPRKLAARLPRPFANTDAEIDDLPENHPRKLAANIRI